MLSKILKRTGRGFNSSKYINNFKRLPIRSMFSPRPLAARFSIQEPPSEPFTYDEIKLEKMKKNLNKTRIGKGLTWCLCAFAAYAYSPYSIFQLEVAFLIDVAFMLSGIHSYRLIRKAQMFKMGLSEDKNEMNQNVSKLIFEFIKQEPELYQLMKEKPPMLHNASFERQEAVGERKYFPKDDLYDSIQKRFLYYSRVISKDGLIVGEIRGRLFYNQSKDYMFERLTISLYDPEFLKFTYMHDLPKDHEEREIE